MPGAAEIVTRFNECINARDLDRLAAMMTDDHAFIDAAGRRISGKAVCVEAWRGFFAAFPNYRNVFSDITEHDDQIVVTGRSECSDGRLSGPALWSATCRGDKVSEWRVWPDNASSRATLRLG